MNQTFSVALLQLRSYGTDIYHNLQAGDQACREAKRRGADLALFPEMWSIGYSDCPEDPAGVAAWRELALARDSSFITDFRELARELNMAIGISYLEAWPEAPRNSLSVIDRQGQMLFTYAKVHTCDFAMEARLTPGQDFYVETLDTLKGPVNLGAMICYDREFPESARVLMLKGAEVVLCPNACTLDFLRLNQLQARAYENMLGIACANYPAPQNNGSSVAYDGIAYAVEDGPAQDMRLIQAGPDEGIFMAHFDLDRLRDYRQREAWGDSYRKPYAYGSLSEDSVKAPFIRADSRRQRPG